MKQIQKLILSLIIISSINLLASDEDNDDNYIDHQPDFESTSKASTDDAKILDQLYETVETGTLDDLEQLLHQYPLECEHLLQTHHKPSTRTPVLHLAIVRANKEMIRTLIEYNANLNLTDITFIGNDNTPLHYAAQLKKYNRLQICQILIAQGAHVDIKNRLGKTPLHLACENYDDPHVPKLLIYHKADIESQTKQGLTPLHIAVARGHFEIVKLLLNCNAKYLAVDYRNRTPMSIAEENRRKHPNVSAYGCILAYLKAHDTIHEIFNVDEPAAKKRRLESKTPN